MNGFSAAGPAVMRLEEAGIRLALFDQNEAVAIEVRTESRTRCELQLGKIGITSHLP